MSSALSNKMVRYEHVRAVHKAVSDWMNAVRSQEGVIVVWCHVNIDFNFLEDGSIKLWRRAYSDNVSSARAIRSFAIS